MIRRGFTLALVLGAAAAVPAAAQEAEGEAVEAFSRGDYAEAAEMWLADAETGSAEAALRLGYLYDLGLGVPADRTKAFRYYLRAANAGIADAAFNVGVMLDSGIGMARDVSAAAVWYARAAARDHMRAQYNLGILYAEGMGVPQNSDLARYWLERIAVAVPAADDRLATLPPAEETWEAPTPVSATMVTREEGAFAELAWTAPAGTPGSSFDVQLLSVDPAGRVVGPIKTATTDASAISLALDDPDHDHVWRVVRTDRRNARYAPGPWRPVGSGAAADDLLGGQVRFEIDMSDERARAMAERLAAVLSGSGVGVTIAPASEPIDSSTVLFAFEQDLSRAAELAAFVPGLGGGNLRRTTSGIDAGPGEVVVQLAFEDQSPT